MAETNHTSSATNNDCNASSPNVPPDADPAPVGLSRRSAMQLISSAAAVPALAYATPLTAHATQTDRLEWHNAYARFKAVNAEYDQRIAAEEAAIELVHRDCPREAKFFDEYKLGIGMKRDDAEWHARYAVVSRKRYGGTTLSKRQADAVRAEADRIVDEFMAYQARYEEAEKRHNVDALKRECEDYRDTYNNARDELMAIPAPDTEALLIKMEMMSWSSKYEEGTLEDARRLLGDRRAS